MITQQKQKQQGSPAQHSAKMAVNAVQPIRSDPNDARCTKTRGGRGGGGGMQGRDVRRDVEAGQTQSAMQVRRGYAGRGGGYELQDIKKGDMYKVQDMGRGDRYLTGDNTICKGEARVVAQELLKSNGTSKHWFTAVFSLLHIHGFVVGPATLILWHSLVWQHKGNTRGTYDFEAVDYDYTQPPPRSPPGPSDRALLNKYGNSSGLVPSIVSAGTDDARRRGSWLRRSTAIVLRHIEHTQGDPQQRGNVNQAPQYQKPVTQVIIYIRQYFEKSLDERWPWWKICIDPEEAKADADMGDTEDVRAEPSSDAKLLSGGWTRKRLHYRLAVAEVGHPLSDFRRGFELVLIIFHYLIAYSQAYEKCHLLHQDISAGNVLIVERSHCVPKKW
ncbi:hypothetical protein BKA93DRAFT_748572 [Sparassis latifolia]